MLGDITATSELYISLMVFRTDTWKRMVIRDIIIFLVSGAAPAGRIQEDTSLMRLQKGSRFVTAVKYAQNRKGTLQQYHKYFMKQDILTNMLKSIL